MFRFSLQHPPEVSQDLYREAPERAARMDKKLSAYVQTAILLLRQRSLGVPAD